MINTNSLTGFNFTDGLQKGRGCERCCERHLYYITPSLAQDKYKSKSANYVYKLWSPIFVFITLLINVKKCCGPSFYTVLRYLISAPLSWDSRLGLVTFIIVYPPWIVLKNYIYIYKYGANTTKSSAYQHRPRQRHQDCKQNNKSDSARLQFRRHPLCVGSGLHNWKQFLELDTGGFKLYTVGLQICRFCW